METGMVEQIHHLPDDEFGEGLTVIDNRLIQLTWKSGKGYVYDKDTFELLDTFYYETEGWGITCDGVYLYMSDGSSTIHVLDTGTYREVKRIHVQFQNLPVTQINELEYIKGAIYANIWKTTDIIIIDPENGFVMGKIDFSTILQEFGNNQGEIDVMNGIAFDQEKDKIYITGKLWSQLFEIEVIEIQ